MGIVPSYSREGPPVCGYSRPPADRDHPVAACSPGAEMSFLIVLAALCFLMFVAYRGYSVILFAP
ncbi:MAG: hypothetical protein ACREO0_13300, partial [Pseudoxanthomonas sp.]